MIKPGPEASGKAGEAQQHGYHDAHAGTHRDVVDAHLPALLGRVRTRLW